LSGDFYPEKWPETAKKLPEPTIYAGFTAFFIAFIFG
jgi:hypothetical protein